MSADPPEQTTVTCFLCESPRVELRFYKNGCGIFRCINCTVQFVFPQPSQLEVLEIYSGDYFRRGNKYLGSLELKSLPQIEQDPRSLTAAPENVNDKQKIEFVVRNIDSGRVLDVGCAMGGFLAAAREEGFDTFGIELSEDAATHSREIRDLNVHTGDIHSAKLDASSFDCVTLWDVIEHVPNPQQVFTEVHRILRPGGTLIFTTGDVQSCWAKLTGRFWQLMTPPQHLFFFTPKSLRSVLSATGFDDVEISHQGKTASLDFITFKAREAFGPFAFPMTLLVKKTKLGNRCFRVNLGDILTCVAKRR